MPAAVVIPAAAALTGSVIQSRGQNRALAVQRRATDQQIQLERERDAARNARYNRAYESYQAEKAQYDQIRRSLLEHYGVKLPGPTGPAGQAPAQARPGGVSLGALMGGGAQPSPWATGAPAGAAPAPALGPPAPEATGPMGEGADVFDWRNYGVR